MGAKTSSHMPEFRTATDSLSCDRRLAMSQISLEEGEDLLSKLLSERIRLSIVFQTPSGTRTILSGFLDSKTLANGLIFLASSPAIDVLRGFLKVPTSGGDCVFMYGEKREVPEEIRKNLSDSDGDSVLIVQFPDFGETLFLFFTL